MYVKELFVDNFRNLQKQKIEFCEGINIFYGLNAQGKSNLLESIRLLSMGRSFRGSKTTELIKFGEDYFYVKAIICQENNDKKIEFGYKKNENKVIKVNGNKIKSTSELLGQLLTVIFSPEDLNIIKEGPSYRRKYLDSCISVVEKNYLYNLMQYNKILINRNKLLKTIKEGKNRSILEIFDDQLVEYGAKIIVVRQSYLKNVEINIKKFLLEISNETAEIVYLNSVGLKDASDEEIVKKRLKEKLLKNIDLDLKYLTTQVGPHREDFKIIINGYDSRVYSSQGQQRTVALCLKLSEFEILKKETGEKPILLLDDVMSELDENRKKYILERLQGFQTFITHTTKRDLKGDCYFKISNGVVIKE
ncbi:DNA replication/repair protein RecF [Thermoanaerobacter siderophilus]|uniref:DNA replication and repair protein RecF n=1 Tax=Thermoanaerobacter siderophilus SR4 TaxID=880478 RepID=I9KTE4_9THEO|nr:DNA replication/repair protein RecF [Thermoanaerobacter siderophilus]EIW00219.1 recF protein [Thermoanaerobacter siderophilus SR4]